MSGTASDDVTDIAWSSDSGPSGICSGLQTWTASGVPLVVGVNIITITASDGTGSTQTTSITVNYDLEGPTIKISNPSTNPVTIYNSTINLAGSVSDPAGVASVAWSNSAGGSGACVGTSVWSAANVVLTLGKQTITITATDKLGNINTETTVITYNDGTLPFITITKPTANSTYTTYASTVNVQGTAGDNIAISSVEYTLNDGSVQPCTGTTAWSTGSVALSVGDNVFKVTAYDNAGNSATDTLTVTLPDTVPPTVTITGPTSDPVYTADYSRITVSGIASDNGELDSLTWTNNLGGSGDCVGTYNWNASGLQLKNGLNHITITCKDAAGNSSTDSIAITYADVTVPIINILTPTTKETYDTTSAKIDVGGTASDDAELAQITWTTSGGASGVCAGTTTWLATKIPLQPGSNQVTVTAKDSAGNTASDNFVATFTDVTAPTISITNPAGERLDRYPNNKYDIAGIAADDVGIISVNWSKPTGESGVCTGLTSWTAKGVPLNLGDNLITVTATDAAGNYCSDNVTIQYLDGDGPVVTIKIPTTLAKYNTSQQTIALGGTAVDVNEVSTVVYSTSTGASGTCSGKQNWSVSDLALVQGDNIVTVTATDNSGNKGTDVLTITVPDSTPPAITILQPTNVPNYSTHSTEVILSGTASDNIGVATVTCANSRGGSTTVNGTNTWNTSAIALQLGTNLITMTAKDAAGKTATDTLSISFTDTTAPSITIESPASGGTYTTTLSKITVTGTAFDDVKVNDVSWLMDNGAKGKATGTNTWTATDIPLRVGDNVLTFTAKDSSGNTTSVTLTVTLVDVPPSISFTIPSKNPTYAASSSPINIGGAASDEIGLVMVTWANDKGGSGICSGTEKWSANNVALVPGVNNITATAKDSGGYTTSATLMITLTDVKPPTITITDPTRGKEYTTDQPKISLAGTALDNVLVTDVKWATDTKNGMCTGTTAWKATDVPLVRGINNVTITASDSTGLATSALLKVTYTPPDVTPPVVIIDTPTMDPTTSTDSPTITIGGTAVDDTSIKTITWSADNGGKGTVKAGSTFNISGIKLTLGVTVITVTATDPVGNVGSDSIAVTLLDIKPPTVKITSPSSSGKYTATKGSVNLGGSASDNIGIAEVDWSTSRGEAGKCVGTAAWKASSIGISPGDTIITITAIDGGGNSGSSQITISYSPADRTAPTISITSPTIAAKYVTSNPVLNLGGIAADDNKVTQIYWGNDRGVAGKGSGTSEWLCDKIPLLAGVNVITATAEDGAGNRTSAQLRVTLTDAVAIQITSPADDGYCKWIGNQVVVSGNAASAKGISKVSWASGSGTSGVCTGTDTWNATVPIFTGTNTITLTALSADNTTATDVIKIDKVESAPGTSWIGLSLISLPLIPAYTDPKVSVGFQDNKWACYSASEGRYYSYPDQVSWFIPADAVQGRGWWTVFSAAPATPIGRLAPQDTAAEIKLYPGWNIIGMPFMQPVKWNVQKLKVRDLNNKETTLDQSATLVAPYAWGWQQNAAKPLTGAYFIVSDPSIALVDRDSLEPWHAYWIKAIEECTLIITPGSAK